MEILIYCQHVLGVGHLFRTLEIAGAMKKHRVTLVLGGPPVSLRLPDHVRVVQLPGLEMDKTFSRLMPVDPSLRLDAVQQQRREELMRTVRECRPDILLIELFPFGRNGFSFELMPLIQAVRAGEIPGCRVVCSVRDILVEKSNPVKYEQRVVERLNSFFDAVLVHGDPDIISLDATFSRMGDIAIPVLYTGYISQRPQPEEGRQLRDELRLLPDQQLIVVSAGSGSVGAKLLESAPEAYPLLESPARMQLFTGPYLDEYRFQEMQRRTPAGVTVKRFSGRFPSWLAAADLSLSMGGYNTTMNLLQAGTPALVYPFGQNREQRVRAECLAEITNLGIITEEDLLPHRLAGRMAEMSGRPKIQARIRLDGAAYTNDWLTNWRAGE